MTNTSHLKALKNACKYDNPAIFYYKLALPTPFPHLIYYSFSESLPLGKRVLVPWGKRQLVGFLIEESPAPKLDIDKIKPIAEVLPDIFYHHESFQQFNQLLNWCAYYYHHPIGEVLATMLPKRALQVKPPLDSNIDTNITVLLADKPLPLTQYQQQTMDTILHNSGTFLLYGATGSGKTEIYLQAAHHYLQQQQQVLVLVPEIGLITQIHQRFQQRFNIEIALYHSALTDKQRMQTWSNCGSTIPMIVIGTRSAIFLPLPRLGIVIMDEEHDLSFRQQEGFKYHARDIATLRCKQQKCQLILGSATPSLESISNMQTKPYHYCVIPTRIANTQPTTVKLVQQFGDSIAQGISTEVIDNIKQTLARGEQAMVFLNRRGYAPIIRCKNCCWTVSCPSCSVYLNYHTSPTASLQCHHCGYISGIPKLCQQCQGFQFESFGYGTEKLEQYLDTIFPNTKIIRIDRDSTRRKGTMQTMLSEIHQAEPCIILGTQMITKGHHFPNLSLVAIIDVDSALFSSDFRAKEQLSQLVTQTIGRVGRGDKVSKALLQTRHPDHPWLQKILHHNYMDNMKELLAQRQTAELPPFSYMATIHSSSTDLCIANDYLEMLKRYMQVISQQNNINIIGPMSSLLEKRNKRYRFQMQLYAKKRSQLHRWIEVAQRWLQNQKRQKQWMASIEIDPLSFD